MWVSLSGCHCSGKSTLFKALQEDEYFKDWTFIGSVTRPIREMGFEINESGGDETQLMCLAKDLQNLFTNREGKKVISDRCLLDTLIYSRYLFKNRKVSLEILSVINTLWENYKRSYNYIVIPDHKEIKLKDDGERSINIEFRESIAELFLEQERYTKMYHLSGNVEERVELVKQIITMR